MSWDLRHSSVLDYLPEGLDEDVKVLCRVDLHRREVGDLALLLESIDDSERNEGGETLAVGRALVKGDVVVVSV